MITLHNWLKQILDEHSDCHSSVFLRYTYIRYATLCTRNQALISRSKLFTPIDSNSRTYITSESKKPRQLPVVYTTGNFFDSDVRLVKKGSSYKSCENTDARKILLQKYCELGKM